MPPRLLPDRSRPSATPARAPRPRRLPSWSAVPRPSPRPRPDAPRPGTNPSGRASASGWLGGGGRAHPWPLGCRAPAPRSVAAPPPNARPPPARHFHFPAGGGRGDRPGAGRRTFRTPAQPPAHLGGPALPQSGRRAVTEGTRGAAPPRPHPSWGAPEGLTFPAPRLHEVSLHLRGKRWECPLGERWCTYQVARARTPEGVFSDRTPLQPLHLYRLQGL